MADEKPVHERVSILETRMDHHDTMLELSMNRVTELADNLITQVERTNTILERFERKLSETTDKVKEWDSIGKTVVKAVIALTVVIGAAWSVFVFAVDHKADVTLTKSVVTQTTIQGDSK